MNYIIESLFEGKWVKIKEDNLSFCKGWLDCKSYQMPRNALRIVSLSGKVYLVHPDVVPAVGMSPALTFSLSVSSH